MTRDWKQNGVDRSNSIPKQLITFIIIAALLYFGGSAFVEEIGTTAGAITLLTAVCSLLGYFGLASNPLPMLLRTNMVSIMCALICIYAIMTEGFTTALFALMVLHLFDGV